MVRLSKREFLLPLRKISLFPKMQLFSKTNQLIILYYYYFIFFIVFLVIIVGSITTILFLVVLGHLAFKLYKYWTSKKIPKYQALARKYGKAKQKSPARVFQPKFSMSFPTSLLPTQFLDKELDENLSNENEYKGGEKRLAEQQKNQNTKIEKSRKYGITNYERPIKDARPRRIFSEPDLFAVLKENRNHAETEEKRKRRTKSEQEMETLIMRTAKRERARSTLQIVPEISGQIEYSVLLNSARNAVEIKIVQIIDMNEVSPELFHDRFPIYNIDEVPSDAEKPHLLRLHNQQLIFSDPNQLGFCVELMKFPKKEHLCTTDYKFGMQNTSFDEMYTLEFKDPKQLKNSVIRLQVLLRYGKQPQRPVILGESVLPLNNCEAKWNLYRDHLKFPMNEKELEVDKKVVIQ